MNARRHGSAGLIQIAILPIIFAALALIMACGGRTVRAATDDPSRVDLAQLWQEPADLQSRDLFAGPTAGSPEPDANVPFTFVEADRTGYSRGYDVRDASGMTWSVKLGAEAQTEVVSSRILWAIGFHQVPTFYRATWSMTGGPGGTPGPARFRPELPDRKSVGEWSWTRNDFTHTQPFKGLIVANLILNNWDWKASNNRIYEISGPDGTKRHYVVRDLGASLGKTSSPPPLRWFGSRIAQGTRNDLADFEGQGFIKGVEGGRIDFDYDGIYKDVVRTVSVADVVWTSRLLAQLSDEQWSDAFRAAGYPPADIARYVAKLKSKVAEGLALAKDPA